MLRRLRRPGGRRLCRRLSSQRLVDDVPEFLWHGGRAPAAAGFGLQNLPFGAFLPADGRPRRLCTRLGDAVVDLSTLSERGLLAPELQSDRLNPFLAKGKDVWRETRQRLQQLLGHDDTKSLIDRPVLLGEILHSASQVKLVLPYTVGGFTDFYASPYHARVNQFPAWWHLPFAYNGRASSVVVSDEPVFRPLGQFIGDAGVPVHGPSEAVDFELEMGVVVGPGNDRGQPIALDDAEDHIFGFTLLNDWSARDIQGWEMQPLGPFLGKSFCTTVAPWVVTAEALEPFRVEGAVQQPEPLPYLRHRDAGRGASGGADVAAPAFDVHLEVEIAPQGGAAEVVCRSNFKHVYWSAAQMVAHHSSNGCPLAPGDLLGTGTVSGPEDFARGCMAEWRRTGQRMGPRGFLLDGDAVTMRGLCSSPDVPFQISFGECRGTLQAAPA